MSQAVDAISSVVNAIGERRKTGQIFRGAFNTEIDWFFDEPEASEPLPDTEIRKVAIPEDKDSMPVLGIDGSSRRFMTPYGGFALATLAVSLGRLPLLDYPPLHYRYIIDPQPTPFIAAYTNLNVNSSLVRTSSPSGYPYQEEGASEGERRSFALADMAHEIRTILETHGIRLSLELLEPLSRSLGGVKPLLLLDGPLYQRPWRSQVLKSGVLREDWKRLTEERVSALKLAQERGVPVIGSVKRLEKSTFLTRIHGTLVQLVKAPFPPQGNDFAEARELACIYVRRELLSGHYMLLIGPFLIYADRLRVPPEVGAPDIVYSYLVFPQLPYAGSIDDTQCNVLRLEVTYEQYKKFGWDVFVKVLSDGLTALGLPWAQVTADRRCKDTSKVLLQMAGQLASDMGVELSYETRMELLGDGGEV